MFEPFVRPVEESNRYAPDTQNRQHALVQKIIMLAKPWCDHVEGFVSGLRVWELDVGEWDRATGTALAAAVKYTVMMNMAPIVLRNSLQLDTCANSAALRTAFVAIVKLVISRLALIFVLLLDFHWEASSYSAHVYPRSSPWY